MQWHLFCGKKDILAQKAVLQELARQSALEGAMDFLDYFLNAPYFGLDVPHASLKAFRLVPNAVLTRRAKLPRVLLRWKNGSVDAAVFVFEYGLHGISTGCYIPADSDGYRTVIASPEKRAEAAVEAGHFLLRQGALLVLISYMQVPVEEQAETAAPRVSVAAKFTADLPPRRHRVLAHQLRELGRKLPLMTDFEATMASVSRNTRHNLRRSMQQAARELGARFEAEADITLPELVELAGQSAYGPPDWAVRERFEAARTLLGGVLAGLRSVEGQWLSAVGAHREAETLCLDWQLNRSGVGSISLATAMRAFLIEAETGRGTRWLRFESGTTHPLQRAFVRETTHDLLFARRFLPVTLVKRLAAGMAEGGPLATVLGSEALIWRS